MFATIRLVASHTDYKERKSPRLPKFDYRAAGAYHCTIVSKDRRCIYSVIEDGKVKLFRLGKLLEECLLDLRQRFDYCDIDFYEIMPNHIHAIVFLQGQAPEWKTESKPGTASRSLSSVIQAFKSKSSRAAKEAGYEDIFQRGFYEHVIRDEEDLDNHRRYIQENPVKWELDKENPANFGRKD